MRELHDSKHENTYIVVTAVSLSSEPDGKFCSFFLNAYNGTFVRSFKRNVDM